MKKKQKRPLAKDGMIQTRFPRPIKRALEEYGRSQIPELSANQANLKLIAERFGFTVENKKWVRRSDNE